MAAGVKNADNTYTVNMHVTKYLANFVLAWSKMSPDELKKALAPSNEGLLKRYKEKDMKAADLSPLPEDIAEEEIAKGDMDDENDV